VAKRKKSSAGKSVFSVLATIWRGFAKGLGNTIRFTTRAAKDLDSAHQRDGAALLLVIIGLAAIAGTWLHSTSSVNKAFYSFFYGGFGRVGVISPLVLFVLQMKIKQPLE
jgi:S-DNA-T family DNA segregation ATPase FtsK/SpoIIIE